MPASDIEQRTDEAVTTVLCQNAALRTAMGRASATDDVVIPWEDLDDARLPAVVKYVGPAAQIGGAGDNWRITYDIGVFAADRAKVRSILEIVESAVTVALLEAEGLDGVVLRVGPRNPIPQEKPGTRDLYAEMTTLSLWVTK